MCCDPERMRNSEWKNPPEKERKKDLSFWWVYQKKKRIETEERGEREREIPILLLNIRASIFVKGFFVLFCNDEHQRRRRLPKITEAKWWW